jgi:hypothetical protein
MEVKLSGFLSGTLPEMERRREVERYGVSQSGQACVCDIARAQVNIQYRAQGFKIPVRGSLKALLDNAGYVHKADPPVKESANSYLIGRIKDRRQHTAR